MRTVTDIKLPGYLLPNNIIAEYLVIADIVSTPEYIGEAERFLSTQSFSDEQNRHAWDALVEMSHAGAQIDVEQLCNKVDREYVAKCIAPQFGKAGGIATLTQHCQLLVDINVKMKAYRASLEMLRMACDSSTPSLDILAIPERLISDIRCEYKCDKDAVKVSDVIDNLADTLESIQVEKGKGKTCRVPTGIPCLDFATYSGFNAGNLVILAARPSVGKTAVMLHMAKAATSSGKAATIFSLEMTNEELAQRLLFSTREVKPGQIARGDVVWPDFEKAAGCFSATQLYLNDTARTVDEIICLAQGGQLGSKGDLKCPLLPA